MSDFKVKVTAELDTSKLKNEKLNDLQGKIKITDVVINRSAIQSALDSASSSAKLKINVDTSYLQKQITSALSSYTKQLGQGSSSQINFSKQFGTLEKDYNRFLANFTKSNGQGFSGLSGIESGIKSIGTAIKTLKSESAKGLLSNDDLGKSIQTQKTYLENLKSQYSSIATAVKQLETGEIDKQISIINQSISKLGGEANTELQSKISGSISEIERLKTALNEAVNTGDTSKITSTFAELQTAIAKVKNGISEVKSVQGGNWIDISKIQDMVREVQKLEGVDVSGIMAKLKSGLDAGAISPGDWAEITNEFKNLYAEATNVGSSAQTAGTSIKSMFAAFTAGISAVTIIHKVNQSIRDMIENVHNIDDAMTELKKVTDESDSAYSNYLKNSASTAKEIGTTISDYVNSTADFARLGNSFTDSQELAKVASVYNIVGDGLTGIDQATEHIISSMYAFGIEASNAMTIVDKFNEVGNNFAITSSGIGEALSRSASSLSAANNDINQSVALITAALLWAVPLVIR